MPKIANTYYSIAHPKVLREDGKRVTRQITTCIKNVSPKSDLKSYKALDIGGSNGVISFYLARFVKYMISIDPDKKAVSDGKRRYCRPNLKLKVFDGRKLPFHNNTFDLVVYRRTYGSVDNKEAMAEEIFRVLKPGGFCYFEGHNKLFLIETDHLIPFLTVMPDRWAKIIISIFKGQRPHYIERYKTFWGNKLLFSNFSIHYLTPLIIKHPLKFKFSRLYKLNLFTKFIPLPFLKYLEPFYPDFIWILIKPSI